MIKKIKSENKIKEYTKKTNDKKIAEDIQNFINEENPKENNLSQEKTTIKVWLVILGVIGFFIGTIIFISLLSMFLTGFR